jgi:hypothetical protein
VSALTKKRLFRFACATFLVAQVGWSAAYAQDTQGEKEKPAAQTEKSGGSKEQDPFADLSPAPKTEEAPSPARTWKETFFTENNSGILDDVIRHNLFPRGSRDLFWRVSHNHVTELQRSRDGRVRVGIGYSPM